MQGNSKPANNAGCPKCKQDTFTINEGKNKDGKYIHGKCTNCGFEDTTPIEGDETYGAPEF